MCPMCTAEPLLEGNRSKAKYAARTSRRRMPSAHVPSGWVPSARVPSGWSRPSGTGLSGSRRRSYRRLRPGPAGRAGRPGRRLRRTATVPGDLVRESFGQPNPCRPAQKPSRPTRIRPRTSRVPRHRGLMPHGRPYAEQPGQHLDRLPYRHMLRMSDVEHGAGWQYRVPGSGHRLRHMAADEPGRPRHHHPHAAHPSGSPLFGRYRSATRGPAGGSRTYPQAPLPQDNPHPTALPSP